MAVDVKAVKAQAVTPPPLVKGRRGSQIPQDLLKAMAEMIKKGEWATVSATFDTRDKASSALTRFRKALKDGDFGLKTAELQGRIWGDNRTSDGSGGETYAAPFHFAIGDKGKTGTADE